MRYKQSKKVTETTESVLKQTDITTAIQNLKLRHRDQLLKKKLKMKLTAEPIIISSDSEFEEPEANVKIEKRLLLHDISDPEVDEPEDEKPIVTSTSVRPANRDSTNFKGFISVTDTSCNNCNINILSHTMVLPSSEPTVTNNSSKEYSSSNTTKTGINFNNTLTVALTSTPMCHLISKDTKANILMSSALTTNEKEVISTSVTSKPIVTGKKDIKEKVCDTDVRKSISNTTKSKTTEAVLNTSVNSKPIVTDHKHVKEKASETDINKGISKELHTPKSVTANGSHSKDKTIIPKDENRKFNKNFLKITKTLISSAFESQYSAILLNDDDHKILKNIQEADTNYQYVCFKLYTHLHKWYKLTKFVDSINVDLKDCQLIELFNFLRTNNIVETDYLKEDTRELLQRLHSSEIKDICSKFKIKNATKKDNIELIIEKCRTQKTLHVSSKSTEDLIKAEIKRHLGKFVVKLKEGFRKSFHRIFILATFTNRMFYDIKDYFRYMADSSGIEFPEYKIEDHVVFYSPAEFLSYVEARTIRDMLDSTEEEKNHIQLLIIARDIFKNLKDMPQVNEGDERYKATPHLIRFTAQSVYISALTHISNILLVKFPDDVKEWLRYLKKTFPKSHRLGDWYYYLCRIFKREKDLEKAAELVITGLSRDKRYLTEVQLETLQDLGSSLKKVCQLTRDNLRPLLRSIELNDFPQVTIDQKTVRGNVPGRRRDYLVEDAEGNKVYKNVESIALDYYIEKCGYSDGIHCEGSVIMALFAFFFWDLIYNPKDLVPGTFLSKIQTCPLDMFTPYFYKHRKNAIDKRIRDIEEKWPGRRLLEFVQQNYDNYFHITSFCDLRSKRSYSTGEVISWATVVECIGRRPLSKIFARLVKDIRQYRSGMPDLLIWDDKLKKAKFVEVKGENDRLSVKQKMWLKYLKSIDAKIEVCHVHSIGSKKKLEKKVEKEENEKDTTNETEISPKKKKMSPQKLAPDERRTSTKKVSKNKHHQSEGKETKEKEASNPSTSKNPEPKHAPSTSKDVNRKRPGVIDDSNSGSESEAGSSSKRTK